MVIFTGVSLMNIAEYKGVFTFQPSHLPNTAADLKANTGGIQKVSVVIDYPYFTVTGALLQDYKKLGMWSEAGDAHHGDVSFEMNVDLRGVYDHDSKNMSKADCEAIRDDTPAWSDNWHKLVPGCGQIVKNDDGTPGTAVKFADDAYSPENNTDFYKECYKEMKTYNDLQAVLFWVWVVFILGYSMALYMQATNRKSGSGGAFIGGTYQFIGTIFVLIMLLMYIVLFSMIIDSGNKLDGSKNTCFMKTINTAIAGATYDKDGAAVSVAAYDWGKLKEYDEGDMFGEGDDAIPTLKPHNMTKDANYGKDNKAFGFDVTSLVLACVAFIATCVNAYQLNGALISGVSAEFSDGFIM